MKAIHCTDIHFDHADEKARDKFYLKVLETGATNMFLTGDISNGVQINAHLQEISDNLPSVNVYYVLGNHDFYGRDIFYTKANLPQADNLYYMTHSDVKPLNDRTVVMGVDGWYDGLVGDPLNTPVWLSDFSMIEDLAIYNNSLFREPLLRKCKMLAEEQRDLLKMKFLRDKDIIEDAEKVFILTHVPPWREASTYRGKPSNAQWLPWFCSSILGDYLEAMSDIHSHVEFIVLCGHSHGKSKHIVKNNLECYTGKAAYGTPMADTIFTF